MTEELDRELVWRQYNLWIDLYKFHMELLLKANAFFYLITGGILTFYFAHPEQKMLKLSLLLPTLISLALGTTFVYATRFARIKRREVMSLSKRMNFEAAPDVNVELVLLWACAMILFVVAASLIILMTAY